jgi:DNA polymerase-3 subunit delta'
MARAPAVQDTEPLPEIDRLEGFPHPREAVELIGHGPAEVELAAALAAGRIHHAWLLAGPAGIGKATLAYRMAMHALAEPFERDAFGGSLGVEAGTIAARQVRAQSHPGLLVVRRGYNMKDKRFPASIGVDEVRRLRSFLGHRAATGAWRVVIVDSADELNVNAANALLKSLEEPPERTLFLIVTSEPGRLLPTIRSRCRRLDLAPLSPVDLERAVRHALAAANREMPDAAAWQTLVRLADGSVRRALSLEGEGGIQLYNDVFGLVAGLPQVRWASVHTLADSMSASAAEVRFELFFELLLDLVARLVRASATAEGDAQELQLAGRLAGEARLASLAALWETVAREKAETVALNLDRKTLILRTVSRLETLARA